MYYNSEHLKLLKSAEGKTLEKVFYHFWVNKANPKDIFSFIEYIELLFNDNTKLILQKAEDIDEMILPLESLDIDYLNVQLQLEFKGSLQYQTRNATNTDAWKNITNHQIEDVLVEEEDEGVYIAEAIIFGTSNNQTIIRIENDSLSAEEYIIE